jgi:hypothetical protein
MLSNQVIENAEQVKYFSVSFFRRLFETLFDSFTKRLEAAQSSYHNTLELEKNRKLKLQMESLLEVKTKPRDPDGWLILETESKSFPLYRGGNTLEGLELRLNASLLHAGNKSYSSNDIIEASGKTYIIKLLPIIYRREGDDK